MKKLMLLMAITGSTVACMKSEEHDPVGNTQDHSFVQMASYSNIAEVETGKLAEEKGNDTSSWFGMMMQMEHKAAQDELAAIADGQGFTVPSGTDSLHKKEKEYLMGLSGRAFDSAYAHLQVSGHQNTITVFRQEIDKGHNEPVRNYARKYLPKIEVHKHMADSIAALY